MEYYIQQGKHSADKDHTTMTWGTLSVDKTVTCDLGVTFYTYSIRMYTWDFDKEFHKWVHSAEHLIAYKEDTGSVRDSLEAVTDNDLSGKVILDISPYKTSPDSFGFRITSMVPLENNQVQELTKRSVSKAITFLEEGEKENEDDFQGIPFARAIACGQFDFHNKERAIQDLKNVKLDELDIEAWHIHSEHQTAYVCDLRFLQPKQTSWDNLTMFSPDFSYRLSELIEHRLPAKLPWSIALVWTFGCMTWMYLCISSDIWDKTDIPMIHAKIIEIIKEGIEVDSLPENHRVQLDALLKNYDQYWA